MADTPPPSPSWKTRAFVFLTSQALSLFGSALVQYALMWHVTLETKSGWLMTLFVLAGFLPTFLMAPFAGVWADRLDRRKLIMVSDGAIALATLGLAAAFWLGDDALWLIFLTAAIRAVGQAVQGPAVSALIPQFVPQDQLTRINGLNAALQSGIMFGAPVLAAVLMTVWPLELVFLTDVVTAALAISLLGFFLKVPPHAKAAAPATVTYFEDLRLGITYVKEHRTLVPLFAFLGGFLALIAPAAFLTPLQVARTFGDEVWRLASIEMVFSVGMMVGGGVIGLWGGFRNRLFTMVMAAAGMALSTLFLAVMPDFWWYLVPMGVFGVFLPFYNTAATVLLQEQVDPDYQGRVFSLFTMLSTSTMPLGMLVFGPLAEVTTVEVLLLVTGAAMLVQLATVVLNRRWMAAGEPPKPPVS